MSVWKYMNHSALQWLRFGLCATATGLCLLSFYLAGTLAERYANADLEEIYVDNSNNALVLEENINQMLSKIDMVLLFTQLDLENHGKILPEHQLLLEKLCQSPSIFNIAVTDNQGNFIYSALPLPHSINIADSEHFKKASVSNADQLYIGAAWISLSTEKPSIFLSRSYQTPSGGFGGLIALALDQNYLDTALQKLNLEHTAITLLLQDGTFLARAPMPPQGKSTAELFKKHPIFEDYINQGITAGSYEAQSPLDSGTDIGVFHVLTNYPLVLMASMPKATAMARSKAQSQEAYFFAGGFSLLVLIASALVWWQLRQQFTIAAQLRLQHHQLEYLSYHDQLTGLYNRYFIEEFAEKEIAHAERYKEDLSMLMFDLDHFKTINDTWGHPIGDQVLKKTAELIKSFTRKADVLGRIGGEEFMLLLPQTDLPAAATAAEKIRKELATTPMPDIGTITVSIGAAVYKSGESFLHWYNRADNALYRAKTAGRNCIRTDGNTGKRTENTAVHLSWDSSWESGNKTLDNQHRHLIKIGGELLQMSLETAKAEAIERKIENLLDHVIYHFATEEHLLQSIDYANTAEHSQQHKELLKKFLQLKNAYEHREIKASSLFSFLIDDVIIDHILLEDKKFFPAIQKHANV